MSFEMLNNFNPQQQLAIKHLNGPCLVCAGPGSGKTTVIVNRIHYLITQHKVDPAKILVITYTKAAAEEMKYRFLNLVKDKCYFKSNVNFGTFHSVFFKVLRRRYNYDLKAILSEQEKHFSLKNITKTLGISNYEDADLFKNLINDISNYKSSIDNDNFQPSSMSFADFQRVNNCYENYKQDCNKIDFDDMLVKCYQLLLKETSILKELRKQYQYILIDEFQDINEIQFAIVKMLAEPINNLFVVGDDDQSIYSFRGAKPKFILDFNKEFPSVEKIIVNNNYRSQEKIIKAANSLIEKNISRIEKKIEATKPPVEDIQLIYPENRAEENKHILQLINQYVDKGYSYRDIAIVYRTNLLANSVINSLLENQIPFQCRDHVNNIYEHWVVEDILYYLKASVASSEANYTAVSAIINKPTRYISKRVVESLGINEGCFFTSIMMQGELKPYQLKRIIQLRQDLIKLRSNNTHDAITIIRKEIGYDKYIEEYCLEKQVSSNDLFEILDEFQELAIKYDSINDFIENINSFKAQLIKHKASKNNDDEVQLLTMHSAKGLEYKVVIVIGAIEGLVPHYKSNSSTDALEEERRLFYVAVTRAKEELIISSPRYRYDKKAEPSRFIEDMKIIKLLSEDIVAGDEVKHKIFGRGLVEAISNKIMTVRFHATNQLKELDIIICSKNNLINKK